MERFATALTEAREVLDEATEHHAQWVLKQAIGARASADPEAIRRISLMMRDIGTSITGNAAWAGVVLGVDQLLRVLGVA